MCASLPLEPPAEIEEIIKGELPRGNEAGSEDLVTCVGRIYEILLPLELQNFHRLGLRVDEPDFGHDRHRPPSAEVQSSQGTICDNQTGTRDAFPAVWIVYLWTLSFRSPLVAVRRSAGA